MEGKQYIFLSEILLDYIYFIIWLTYDRLNVPYDTRHYDTLMQL